MHQALFADLVELKAGVGGTFFFGRENLLSFQRIWLKPRVLVKVSQTCSSTTVLGFDSSFPVYLSAVALQVPNNSLFLLHSLMCVRAVDCWMLTAMLVVGAQNLGHHDAELNWVRAAASERVQCMIGTLASCGLDELCSTASELGSSLFFQL